MLTIVTALPWEADRFARRLRGRERQEIADGWIERGGRAATPLRVLVSGPGPDHVRHAAAALGRIEPPPTDLISTGVGAGLQEGLSAGSLILANRLLTSATPALDPRALEADANLSRRISEALVHASIDFLAGANLTVPSVLISPQEKQQAAHASRAVLAQMEDQIWAEAAAASGWRFASIRAVLDPIDRPLPEAVPAWDWRGPRLTQVIAATLRRPWLPLSLARLGWQREQARRSIDRALEAVVAYDAPPPGGETP